MKIKSELYKEPEKAYDKIKEALKGTIAIIMISFFTNNYINIINIIILLVIVMGIRKHQKEQTKKEEEKTKEVENNGQ